MRHFPPNSVNSKDGKERITVEGKKSVMVHSTAVPDPEVPEKAAHRNFTAAYKFRILKEAESCTVPRQLVPPSADKGSTHQASSYDDGRLPLPRCICTSPPVDSLPIRGVPCFTSLEFLGSLTPSCVLPRISCVFPSLCGFASKAIGSDLHPCRVP